MSNINNSEQEELQILKNIERLQNMEKDLYKELEANGPTASGPTAKGPTAKGPMANGPITNGPTANGPITNGPITNGPTANVDSIVNRINQLSEIRLSLYNTLNYTYKALQKSVNTSRTELVELLTLVNTVEDELNNAKIQLNQMYEIKHNKMRMVEINTYYGKRYRAQAGVMKLVIFVGVILLALIILNKKGWLPETIANILLGTVFAVGGFFIIWRVLDISWRDNMNFDAYNWQFNPDAKAKTEYNYNMPSIDFNPEKPLVDCIGNACCTAGMIYDAQMRKCIKDVAPETFVSGQLTKHCFKNKPQASKLNAQSSPLPYGSDETINFASV